MIIEVIPFDVSIDDSSLSYFVKDELKSEVNIWSIVEIPFKSGIILWIISKLDSEILEWDVKSIVSIVYNKSVLSQYQIDLIYRLSEKYFINIHMVLALFMPKYIYNFLEKKSFKDLSKPLINEKLSKDKKLFYCNKTDVFEKIIELIEENIWTVIVFPDDFMLEDFLKKHKEFEEKSIVYKNKLTYTKKYKSFIEAYNRSKNIIIWTRKILAYNLEAYEKILYVEDIFLKYLHSYNHKYKNLEILENLEKYGKFEINIIWKIPSLDLLFKASKGEYKLVNN